MSDTPKLRDQALDPEMIATMGVAFDDVRHRLGLARHDDVLTGYVARTVIEMAHRGCRNAAALADAVMHRLEDEAIVDACGEGFVDAAHGSRAGGQVTYPCGDTRGILSDRRDRSPD